ncbi:hypothetical protein [Nocardia sp. NPDC057353]|uniref:hypothetical protein n=1 Tax=Nocardia sp. NPDC057353 TaxID=3346104 RepID=UPI00362D6161
MARVTKVAFRISWTTIYPELLAENRGKLITSAGYRALFDSYNPNLTMPWNHYPQRKHWSRFWSSYLAAPSKMHGIRWDAAYARRLPFQWWEPVTLSGPGGASGVMRVRMYPWAVVVLAQIEAVGAWPVPELAHSVSDLRRAREWRAAQVDARADRSLDGLADELRERIGNPHLTDGQLGDPWPANVYTIGAPIRGEGSLSDFEFENVAAASCLAGLASLGPPGDYDSERLTAANRTSQWSTRAYVSRDGHAIWNPTTFTDPNAGHTLDCLLANQADAISHIDALEGALSWAAEQIAESLPIPTAAQPTVLRVSEILEQLYRGDKRKTYRSGVARLRIEKYIDSIAPVRAAL